MQRVRIGLTGLAFIFVLVLLAAIFSNPSDEKPITANTIAMGTSGQAEAPAVEPAEPLAELGVAPGKSEANAASEENPVPAGE
ncbi:hypothetical protein [Allosphingosinicella humi]